MLYFFLCLFVFSFCRKSTLFNVLTSSQVAAENFPFCTIDPNENKYHIHLNAYAKTFFNYLYYLFFYAFCGPLINV